MYGRNSDREGGILLQLRNPLNRSSVPNDRKKDVNAAEDFLQIVLIGHVVAAGMEVLGMTSMEDQPNDIFPLSRSQLSKVEKQQVMAKIAHSVVTCFVNLTTLESTEGEGKAGKGKKDGIHEYAKECQTFCLLKVEFDDAIHEGDGQRLIRCWKFLFLIFKASNHKNYSIEALNLLAQYYILLPPRLAAQLLCSRFVNVHGKPGCNIACDLHMEHINAACKFAIAGLGSNVHVTPQAISRIGRCIGPLMKICEQYDSVFGLHSISGDHNMPNISKDIAAVVKELTQKSSVFHIKEGRFHRSFKSVSGSLISRLHKKELLKWMNTKLRNALI